MDRGGAETFIMNVYREINRSKVQFDFIVHTDKKCDYDDEIKSLGGKIYSLPRYKVYNDLEYKRAWRNFFKLHKEYNVIHGHMTSTASIYFKIAKEFGLKTIAHSHSTSSGVGLKSILVDYLNKNLNAVSDYKFACSKEAGEWLYGRYSDFNIIKNGIKVENFIFNKEVRKQKREELNLNNKIVIGHVGNFRYPKNHDFILNLFKDIYDENKNYKLILVGRAVKENLLEQVRKMGLEDGVIFLGSRSDVNELLQAFDIFIMPSIYEGLGVSAIEAQISGLKCYLSDKIPREIKITDNVKFLSIDKNESRELWKQNLLDKKEYNRKIHQKKIIEGGYDVSKISEYLETFYKDIR